MLRIDLAELIRHPGKHIVVDVDEMPLGDEDLTYIAPAKGRIIITNSGDLLLVRGRIRTTLQLECGRCLGEARVPIDAEIEEQYSLSSVENGTFHDTQITVVADEENEVPEGLMSGTVMDLNVLIRQAAILTAPLGPVCKEDCKGLCPKCGKNLNDANGGCRCADSFHHTPLAALRTLYQEGQAGGEGS